VGASPPQQTSREAGKEGKVALRMAGFVLRISREFLAERSFLGYSPSIMSQLILRKQAESFQRPFPELKPGYTVRVHQKVKEGEKERVQMFEGLIISLHRGRVPTDNSFTVRRIVEGVGVEKVFPLFSPNIVKIDVVKVAKVRRAKLFFLRGRAGKSARLSERFTKADEFQAAVEEESPVPMEATGE